MQASARVLLDAPGCSNTTWPATASHPRGNYTYFCGTSAAAPFVSGLAALALSYVPSASAAEVNRAIEESAHQTADSNSAYGLIDAQASLEALAALPAHSTVSFTPIALRSHALTVHLANTSTAPGPYRWALGDGKASGKSSPTHHYRKPGPYMVTLASGSRATAVRLIVRRGR